MTERRLTPRDIAESRAVSVDTVLGWIRAGELRAVNVARRAGGKKPRWRIAPADLERFEAARSNTPLPKPQRRRRRAGGTVTQYV